ncbi:MAG: acetylglutamate kinase [Candidatus Omnitrophica bacterium]|nr:acetylglutamate kinase [Candidatus Omnitrophota bacterium]
MAFNVALDPHLQTAKGKADILMEALPYLKAFRDKTFVIKYGGSALGDAALRRGILEDIVFLSLVGIRPVLVHGGGPDISQRMAATGKQAQFVEGLRVTDQHTLDIVAAALRELNDLLVREIRELGGRAAGFSKPQATALETRRLWVKGQDIGFVGEIVAVHPKRILHAMHQDKIPVVWPLGKGKGNQLYNVNADQAAADLAAALQAEKFVMVTDVRGILRRPDDEESLIPSVNIKQVENLIEDGTIVKGMIPKARACVYALRERVKKTHMIDIKIPHGLLLEFFTDRGIGTEIVRSR